MSQVTTKDEAAYRELVEPFRGELHAHCYRMLGSVHDADDALQDAMLRAWRALPSFEGRSSLRSWLYKIATNTCLDLIGSRQKRLMPIDTGPPTAPEDGPGEPLIESVWVEPYPDEQLGVEDGYASPDARYERRESIELAFIAALQNLPGTQRAVLIMREVLGFSAKETADALDTTAVSVNSALQRARATVEERLPEQSQQETLRSIGDEELRELVRTYVDAWERGDVETVVTMLSEDAVFAMPPLRSWFHTREPIREFLTLYPMSGAWRWKALLTTASGQPALGFYTWDDDEGAYLPFALNVLTFRGREISDVTAYINRTIEPEERERYHRWVDEATDERRNTALFEGFGLPMRLDA
ncbi:MAG: sigma-70 family RNA polymerase sigma factor [Thermoleophilaceae bacterium]